MTMEDWTKRIEFEKYRIIQDRLFRSDFDKFDGNEDLPSLDFKE